MSNLDLLQTIWAILGFQRNNHHSHRAHTACYRFIDLMFHLQFHLFLIVFFCMHGYYQIDSPYILQGEISEISVLIYQSSSLVSIHFKSGAPRMTSTFSSSHCYSEFASANTQEPRGGIISIITNSTKKKDLNF